MEPEETGENTVTCAAAESEENGGEKTGKEKFRTILGRILAVAGIIALILVLWYDMHEPSGSAGSVVFPVQNTIEGGTLSWSEVEKPKHC